MTEPIIYVDRSEIVAGGIDELRRRIGELAAFVEANEPQLIGYSVYLDPGATEMTVIHVHRDPPSLEDHMALAGPRFPHFAELVHLRSIDVYGRPTDRALVQLRSKAELLGGARVTVHTPQAGFVRSAIDSTTSAAG